MAGDRPTDLQLAVKGIAALEFSFQLSHKLIILAWTGGNNYIPVINVI